MSGLCPHDKDVQPPRRINKTTFLASYINIKMVHIITI